MGRPSQDILQDTQGMLQRLEEQEPLGKGRKEESWEKAEFRQISTRTCKPAKRVPED